MESLQNNEANVEAQANGDEMLLAEQEALGQHGQPVVAEQSQEQPLTEESEARKFQSMYDRSQAELQGLKNMSHWLIF